MKRKNTLWKKFLVVLVAFFSLSLITPELNNTLGITQTVQAAVKLNYKSVTMTKGQKKTLKLSGTKKTPTWSSSAPSVASVSKKGLVTAKKRGTTTITAKVGSKKYTCKVTVETPALNKTSISLTVGKTYQLKVNGTKRTVTWKHANKKIATVNKSGKVTAKGTGTTTITATVGGKSYTCKVTVKAAASSTQKTAFNKIKNYILNNGSTNSSGNKFIKFSRYNDGTTYQWAIVYERKSDSLDFILTSDGDGASSALDMTFKVNVNTTNSEFVFIMESYGYAYIASAPINVKTFTENTKLSFTIDSATSYDIPYSTMNNLANSFLQLGFSGWNTLLNRAGTSFKALGFTAYK